MGVPTSDVGYTSATTGRGGHEVHKGHVVALGKEVGKERDCQGETEVTRKLFHYHFANRKSHMDWRGIEQELPRREPGD
jgi:hypothetical protein